MRDFGAGIEGDEEDAHVFLANEPLVHMDIEKAIWYPADALKRNQGFERAELVVRSAMKRGVMLAEPKIKLVREKFQERCAAFEEESAELEELAEMKWQAGQTEVDSGSMHVQIASDFLTKRSQDVRARLERNVLMAMSDEEAARLTVLRMVSALRVLDTVDWGEGLPVLRRKAYDVEVRHATPTLLCTAEGST
jgi:hypothetical protein